MTRKYDRFACVSMGFQVRPMYHSIRADGIYALPMFAAEDVTCCFVYSMQFTADHYQQKEDNAK